MRSPKRGGFTLVELLVTVAIIAIVASIALISYLSAITRARQKRTMTDMRQIAQAWEARAADTRSYVVAGAGYTYPATPYTFSTLRGVLEPTYIRGLPQFDGWGRPFQFAVDPDPEARIYAIRSAGRDGVWESEYAPGITEDPDCDIVYANGAFVTYPSTLQR
jgi:general secretion pathway protein G